MRVNGVIEGKRVKTTINVDVALWKKFSILVIEKHGCRKKNDVIEELIQAFVEEEEKKKENQTK